MPGKETFLLVSLEEEKAKKLAQVITSGTCRKMLDELANKDYTETDLAKALQLPLSTVHYNLQHLVSAGLVKADEFHYSEKGKEVNHYSLANKFVIIAPKKADEGVMNRLKRLITTIVAVGGIGLAYSYSKGRGIGGISIMQKAAVMEAAPLLKTASADKLMAAPAMAESANAAREAVQTSVSTSDPSFILWFVITAVLAVVIYFIADYVWKKIEG